MSENVINKNKWLHRVLASEDKSCKFLFWYILISSIVNVVLIAIFIWGNYEFRIESNFDGTIATILSVLGVFIAFTAINIYSVFNSRVNEEKGKLEELKIRYIKDLEKLEDRFADLGKRENKIKVATERIELTNDILDIISVNVQMPDRLTAIWKTIRRIQDKEKEIKENNLKSQDEELESELYALKVKIKSRLTPHFQLLESETNEYFKKAYKNLKSKLE